MTHPTPDSPQALPLRLVHDMAPAEAIGHWFDGDNVQHEEVLGHQRVSGIEGQCRLCLNAGPLLLSHVEPKWAYRLFAGPEVFHTVDGMSDSIVRQDGAKAYMLCSSCEQYLGLAERHLATICRGGAVEMTSGGISVGPALSDARGDRALLSGVDPTLLIRALLGILLKRFWFPGTVRGSIDELTQSEAENIREAVLGDTYPPHLYATHAVKWFDARPLGLSPKGLLLTEVAPGRPRNVAILIGGLTFFMSMNGSFVERKRLAREFAGESFELGVRARWTVMCADFADNNSFNAYLSLMHPGSTPSQVNAKIRRALRQKWALRLSAGRAGSCCVSSCSGERDG